MEFLNAITAQEALEQIRSFPLQELKSCTVATEKALGRVLAKDITAAEDIPPFSRSLVDGYAVMVKDTYGARETSPAFLYVVGQVAVGEASVLPVQEGQAIYIATGAMIPAGADGVVMQEYTRLASDAVEVTKTLRKGENIVFAGEDIRKDAMVLTKGTELGPFDLGVLSALGVKESEVFNKPRIGLISSGNEIVSIETALPPPGTVRDINRYAIAGLMERAGCEVNFLGIARDTIEDISEKLTRAAEDFDLILVSGGSSKGQADFITDCIERLGGEVLFHGINIKPGKPTIFATLRDKPVFGLPGHPVSCSMVVIRFVLAMIKRMKGDIRPNLPGLIGVLSINIPSSYGVEEYVRVHVDKDGENVTVTPLFAKSSVISTLSKADGYVVVSEGKEGLEQGESVEVNLFG
jgi:molybdopterin molybdotransferase